MSHAFTVNITNEENRYFLKELISDISDCLAFIRNEVLFSVCLKEKLRKILKR